MADQREVIYTPQSQLRRPGQLLRRLGCDLWASRELGWRLLVRNLNARYRQTLLGFVWALLPPLGTTAVWVFLNSQRVVTFKLPAGVPYFVFVLTGMVLWQTFADAVHAPLKLAEESKQMLAKIYFPREALLFTAIGEVFFGFLIRLAVLLGVLVLFQVPVGWSVLLAPLGITALGGFGIVLGVLLVPPGILYQDFGRGLILLLQVWMYASPVIYPPPQQGMAALLNWLNPVSPLLSTTRDWILSGSTPSLPAFLVVTVATCCLASLVLVIYRLAMPILIERMSA